MLNLEQVFIRVVEAGSLKAAAEQMNTDPSSISRKVAMLESRLGVKLLQRSTRKSYPTEAGEQYYIGIRKLQDEQSALEAAITKANEVPQGTLCVTAPVDFGARFVTPVLQHMHEIYPELNVEILLGSHFEDIRSQGIDVAIRIGRLPDSSLICRKLGDVPRVLVASKTYLEQRGRPKTPDQLTQLPFIFYSSSQSRSPVTLFEQNKAIDVEVSGQFTVNSIASVKQLVMSGAGIHLGPMWAFKEEIEQGELEVVLPDYQLKSYPVHALYTSRAFVPAKIRKFIDLMQSQHYDFS